MPINDRNDFPDAVRTDEIRDRYPEQKPVCLNYATCRQDIFALLALMERLQWQKEYYRELCARQADNAMASASGGRRL